MKFLTLTAAALGLMATTSIASANDAMELSTKPNKTIQEQRAYDYEFNRDEQCQGYALGVKRLGYNDPCEKDDDEKSTSALNVLSEYVVYFDFDSANIRANDQNTLRRAANEIGKYNPRQVRVAGYTDTRGSMAYNAALSADRADNVSDFLTDLGVSNFVVDEEALGETNLAVPTADEVKSQANRRVVIQFVQ